VEEINWESLTDAEVERVFRAIDESELEIRKSNRAVVCQLVEAGLRVFEITALQLSDIRLHREGAIRVFGGKSEPPREIPISGPLFAALRDHVSVHRCSLEKPAIIHQRLKTATSLLIYI
jgi:integrase